jgi:glycosyltransferase involved in cell wall biosynthesis
MNSAMMTDAGINPVQTDSPAASTAMPSIALLTGGGDRPYALGLAMSLMAEGMAFDFIASNNLESPELRDSPLVRFLNLRGDQSPTASLPRKVVRIIVYYGRLLSYAMRSRARVFHILWNNKLEHFDRTLLLLFYRFLGRRIVFTAHNVNVRKRDGNDNWFNRLTLRIQYRLISHVFVHTERMKRELLEDFGVRSDRISVIPFGVNSTVPDTTLTSCQARKKLGLEPEHKVMLFFGNIAPYKGLEFLVKAAAAVIRDMRELRLVIAGRLRCDSGYWAAIEQRITRPELVGCVIARIEYVPDVETEMYFKAADVLVLPYTKIFQSGVLFLGYNFGLPVIASDVGSLKDDIVEGRTGSVCRPEDPMDLARCITDYFASDLYRTLPACRAEIRAFAHQQHSWARVAEITRKVYSDVSATK